MAIDRSSGSATAGTRAQSDADTVDGLEGSQFLRSDQEDTATGDLTIENVSPALFLNESGVTADNGNWVIQVEGEAFYIQALNDAGVGAVNVLKIDRTGTTVDKLTLSGSELNVSGAFVTENSGPTHKWIETGVNTDQGYWRLRANNEAFLGTITDDAEANEATWLQVDRSGTGASVAVDKITLSSSELNVSTGISIGAGIDLLDNYEEGTFTPELWDDSGSGSEGQTYNSPGQDGYYTRIGNMVHINIHLSVNSLGTLSGGQGARIGGLPFANTASHISAIYVGNAASLNITAGYAVSGSIAASASVIDLQIWDGTTGTSALTITELSAGGTLIIQGSYPTDA